MKKTYLFYDIETTGLNPCFDQVLQFAAIRTDLELNEIERYEMNVKLNCDVIPAPAAIITHRIGIEQSQNGIDEYSAIIQIHKLLNSPGTISLGYNTLGFDDEFLRFSFYRNLLPPYSHQFAQSCSRMDLYPLTVMYYLFNPDALAHWPQHNQQISLKLEKLSEANQLAQGQAHTAMVDVTATLALAKKFIQKREMWDYLIGYFNKETDLSRSAQLNTAFTINQQPYREALLVDGKFGAKCNYLAPVLHLGQHDHYKNQNLWLRLDCEDITAQNYVIRKKPAESELLLPMKPRYLTKLSPDRQHLSEKNKIWLRENPEKLMTIGAYHRQYTYPKVLNIDADAALYEIGFSNDAEKILLQKFHQAPAAKKMQVAAQFPNPIHREQALRIMGRHFLNHLTVAEQDLFKDYTLKATHSSEGPPIDYRGQYKLTIPKALAELVTLKNSSLSPDQHALLTEFSNYYS